ncbi:hypothetical protein GcC1_03069 [Golovinomyces cichoracearum]|uniref:Uncharacterized protein n=1 Tax=Golovinomyces cichoracearum TaxID=62708 RepID=A0A420H9L6_9PEZI|nr:hypothetical protein GcC1_03069 [Golovinomyces cichoracearum]
MIKLLLVTACYQIADTIAMDTKYAFCHQDVRFRSLSFSGDSNPTMITQVIEQKPCGKIRKTVIEIISLSVNGSLQFKEKSSEVFFLVLFF